MKSKKQARMRRATRTRVRIRLQGISRLCIHRTPRHLYAQVIAANGSEVLASASTLDKEIRSDVKYSGNIDAAIVVGKKLAERAKKAGVTQVAFDRSGFKFHGRIKALADAARKQGLEF
jgi:large subunit ribosomal protein L18